MPELYFRKHIRLKGFDYTSSHYYFVTICTENWEPLFVPRISKKYDFTSSVATASSSNLIFPHVAAASYAANCRVVENTNIVEKCILDIEQKYYENVELDFYCIMPNHIHLIIGFHGPVKRQGAIGSRSYKLSQLITAIKAPTSRDIGRPVWQPNYYEHIIRSEDNLNSIRNYILNNPSVNYEDIEWKEIDSVMKG